MVGIGNLAQKHAHRSLSLLHAQNSGRTWCSPHCVECTRTLVVGTLSILPAGHMLRTSSAMYVTYMACQFGRYRCTEGAVPRLGLPLSGTTLRSGRHCDYTVLYCGTTLFFVVSSRTYIFVDSYGRCCTTCHTTSHHEILTHGVLPESVQQGM